MFKDVATFTVIDEEPFFASFEQAIPRFDEIGCVGLEYWKYPDVSDLAGTYVFEAGRSKASLQLKSSSDIKCLPLETSIV